MQNKSENKEKLSACQVCTGQCGSCLGHDISNEFINYHDEDEIMKSS